VKISLPQLMASVLASVSAAVIASFFGVAGTLVGTALGSVVVTVGGAIFLHSINKTHSWVKERLPRDPSPAERGRTGVAAEHVEARVVDPPPVPAGLASAPGGSGPARCPSAGEGATSGGTAAASGRTVVARSGPVAAPLGWGPQAPGRAASGGRRGRRPPSRPARRLAWPRLAVMTVVVFLLAVGLVTAIEVGARAPLSQLVQGQTISRFETTVGSLFGGDQPVPGSGSEPGNGSNSQPSSGGQPSSPTTTAPASPTTTSTTAPASPTTTAPRGATK